jgi:hypothetical protein
MLLLSVRFRAEQVKALMEYSKSKHLSVGWLVRQAVDDLLVKLKHQKK